MKKSGIQASKGYAIGRVLLKQNQDIQISDDTCQDPELEAEKLDKAIELSRSQLEALSSKTRDEIGEAEAEVFDCHIMFLDDPEFTGAARLNIIDKAQSAQKAVSEITNMYFEMLSNLEDEYMKERAADVKDVGQRLLRNLTGIGESSLANMSENTIIVAHDLTPSDTALLDKSKVSAFLTDTGGKTSHSAIMARTLEIPAVVGLSDIISSVRDNDLVIVDGFEGIVIIDPDDTLINEYQEKNLKFQQEKIRLRNLVNIKTVTKSGKYITVAGNIGSPKDIDKVIENGGEGVGLFRTEFLYMDRDTFPSEQEQFDAYKYVAEKMAGKPVVIRTLDIGGDKKLSYMPLNPEENPFLGFRAIRLCLNRKDLFKTQLRAILKASAFGNINIMFPMISSVDEFLQAKEILHECMKELSNEGVEYNKDIPTGIMVEIPSAAVMADEFAKHVDFFSIGTNDLTQYTLAVDRMNENVSYLYNSMHPAVMKLIKMTIDAAHKQGKWCGMCGELAGDENAIPTLLEYGLDEFSMSASAILRAKEIIIS